MSTDVLISDSIPTSATTEVGERSMAPVAMKATSVSGQPVSRDVLDDSQAQTASSIVRDFVQLTKPRIVVMILVTTLMTALIGASGLVAFGSLVWLMIATGMVAGSAGAANQIWERVIDRRMPRTALRPLPDCRVNVLVATVFTSVMGTLGVWLLGEMFGWAPALASVATWLMYVMIYTPMKTRTAWNTTVGAVAGALPVLIGYTATGGQITDWTGWLLVGVLVAWQYPHFMSIAWMYRRQYAEAGFKMTTTVEPTGRSAGLQSIAGSLAIIACGIVLVWIPGGFWMAVLASIGVVAACYPMLKASVRFSLEPNDQRARKLLRSSLLVLPFVLLIVTLRVFF